MISRICSVLFLGAVVAKSTFALPHSHNAHTRRAVTELKQDAFEEAQAPDNTATKALTGTEIKTSNGQCLFVDKLSGDFRANLTPIQVATCDGSQGQKWDVITAGKHNNKPGAMLVVSGLTGACMNFDDRRAAGNQVILFSCGGRADGEGQVTDSQLFDFQNGAAGPRSLSPLNSQGKTCFTVKGSTIDQAGCANGDGNQQFTFGAGGGAAGAAAGVAAKGGNGNAAQATSNANENSTGSSTGAATNGTATCPGN